MDWGRSGADSRGPVAMDVGCGRGLWGARLAARGWVAGGGCVWVGAGAGVGVCGVVLRGWVGAGGGCGLGIVEE